MWGQQPALKMRIAPYKELVELCNSITSSVILMIEAYDSIENIDSIAAVEGVDVLLVGCLDMSTDMGMPGEYQRSEFRKVLEIVSAACQRHGRLMGLAGLYNNPEIQDWAINELQVRFLLCQQDSNILAVGATECAVGVSQVDRTYVVNGGTKDTKMLKTTNGH